jgi:hypothetical protein
MKNFISVSACFFSILYSSTCTAALQYPSIGGIETLEWLPLENTVSQTPQDALTAYASDGWRLATEVEVNALLTGTLGIGNIYSTSVFPEAGNFFQSFGLPGDPVDDFDAFSSERTIDGTDYVISSWLGWYNCGTNCFSKSLIEVGILASLASTNSGLDDTSLLNLALEDPSSGIGYFELNSGTISASDQYGSFLVRDLDIGEVPLPASGFLLLSGLVFFLRLRHRKESN